MKKTVWSKLSLLWRAETEDVAGGVQVMADAEDVGVASAPPLSDAFRK